MKNLKIFKDLQELSKFAAGQFIAIGNKKINKNGRFAVALSGGSTPKTLYNLLLTDEFKEKIDWERVFFFFSDERDVSPISEKSNFRMANESFLKPLNIPKSNVFRWHTEIINASEVAESYERSIIKFFNLAEGKFPNFDLIFLGLGDDGHTASLFPFTEALEENEKIVISNYVEKLDTNRLTFTFPTINNAENVVFLVSGKNKAAALKEILNGKENCEKFPAQCVKVPDGKLLWLTDEESALLLK